jgi:hypothetical protein
MSNNLDSDSRLAVAFGNGDTVRVWIESAKSHMTTPMGDMDPPMDAVLNKQYVMTLDAATGRLKTITAPKLDDDPMGLGNMGGNQSFGFDLPLPSQPLRAGVAWTDSTEQNAASDSPQKLKVTTINNYTVVGDTTYDGMAVVAVDVKNSTKTVGTVAVANAGMTVNVNSQDEGTGRLYYSPALHLVVRREINGTGKGTQAVEGPVSMTMTSSQKTEQRLTLIH